MNKFTGTILTIPKMSGNVGAKTINIGDKGDDGATFIPSVSEDGVLSWTNDRELDNPAPVNIKGPKGDPGDDYILTEADKAEIAEMAAEMVEVPESGGDVDLTGYATEQYVQDYAQPKGDYLTAVPDGYAKTEDIPTKPEDIGAQPAGNYLTEVPSGYATEEFVKNKIAEAELGGEEVDLSGYAQKSELPTKVSQLENDKGYLTEHQDISGKLDANKLPEAINTALAQAKASGEFDGKDGVDGKDGAKGDKGDKGDTGATGAQGEPGKDGADGQPGKDGSNGQPGADGVSPTVAVNKSGKVTTVSITDKDGTKTVTINDGADGAAGSAGKDGTSVTVKSVSESTADGGSNVVAFSDGKTVTIKNGSKGSTGAAGYTPVKGVDYFDGKDGKDGADGKDGLDATPVTPLFVNTIEECTDTTKLYVLPDGYIYAYMKSDGYTNQVPISIDKDGTVFNGVGYQDNSRLVYTTSGDTTEALASHVATGYIPMAHTDTIRMSGVTWGKTNKNCIAFFDENFMPMGCYIGNGYVEAAPTSVTGKAKKVSCLGDRSRHSVTVKDGVSTFTITFLDADKETTSIINYSGEHVKYFRIGAEGSGANMVVTVNEEIAGSQPEGEYAWCNTGHAFVPADYEDRILELEEKVEALSDRNDMGADVAGQLYTFKGKKIMFFGDSITRNEASYIQNLLDRTGMIRVANFAIDGAKLRNKGDTQMDGNPSFELNNTVPNQVQKLLNNISSYDVPDIIIVSAGTNDDSAESGYDEGKYTDDTGAYIELDAISLTNFSGAMRWIYEKLISCYPNARIFFATPIQASYGSRTYATTKTKAECIKQNCERLSTPYIDAFSKSGIYSRYETQSANGKYLKDGLHPNSDGAVVLAKCYHRELANALIEDIT